jgi:hypothetical protein
MRSVGITKFSVGVLHLFVARRTNLRVLTVPEFLTRSETFMQVWSVIIASLRFGVSRQQAIPEYPGEPQVFGYSETLA